MTRETRHRFTSDGEDQDEDGYDDQWPPRLPTSSRRYVLPTTTSQQQGTTRYTLHPSQVQRMPIPARQSAQRLTQEPPAAFPRSSKRRSGGGVFRSHPLLWIGFGMLVMLLAWTGLQALGAWWSLHQDDATYGRPRTAQYDVVVGHNDSASSPTHFIALNLHATVEVIELPGGDPLKPKSTAGRNSWARVRTSTRSRSRFLIQLAAASLPWTSMCRERPWSI